MNLRFGTSGFNKHGIITVMKNTVFAFCAAMAAVSLAAGKPEISWSIMHPTAIDIAYMKRVVQKAVEYGGVD